MKITDKGKWLVLPLCAMWLNNDTLEDTLEAHNCGFESVALSVWWDMFFSARPIQYTLTQTEEVLAYDTASAAFDTLLTAALPMEVDMLIDEGTL